MSCARTLRVKPVALLLLQAQVLFCTLVARPMGILWRVIEWIGLILAVGIAGLAALFFAARRRILRGAATDLSGEKLLLAAGARAAEYNHGNGKPGAPRSGAAAGILMLFATGLYFRSWIGRREVFVAGPAISWIGGSERHRIVVRYLNASGKEDGIALQLLYPEQWVEAIKTHLISRVS